MVQGLTHLYSFPTRVYQIDNAKLIWLNKRFGEFESLEFIKRFSVAIPSSCFEEVSFDRNNTRVLQSEFYGGDGVGFNGGGVRVVNDGSFQIKGIGANQLAGSMTDFDHSSGMYPLFEAITESINSLIMNKFLPVGTVQHFGLLSIGLSASNAFKGGSTPLALGVREKSLRLGHFFRNGLFEPKHKELINRYCDVTRVRNICVSFYRSIEEHDGFVFYLKKLLDNAANQFAYSFVHGISHGAVTPSNISIEGKWLDLTNCTFVPNGINYTAANDTVSFLDEPMEFIKVIEEFTYTIAKYNSFFIDLVTLTHYFEKSFHNYRIQHSLSLFGLPCSMVSSQNKTEALLIADFVASARHHKPSAKIGFPKERPAHDPLTDFIDDFCLRFLRHKPIAHKKNVVVYKALKKFLLASDAQPNYARFVIWNFRRQYFVQSFFVGNIQSEARAFIQNNGGECVDTWIDAYESFIHLVFGDLDSNEFSIVYSDSNICVSYNHCSGQFELVFHESDDCEAILGLEKILRFIDDYVQPARFSFCAISNVVDVLAKLSYLERTI